MYSWEIWKEIFVWNHLNFAFEFHENNYKVSKKIGKIDETTFAEVTGEGTYFLGDGSFSGPLNSCKDELEGNPSHWYISKWGSINHFWIVDLVS